MHPVSSAVSNVREQPAQEPKIYRCLEVFKKKICCCFSPQEDPPPIPNPVVIVPPPRIVLSESAAAAVIQPPHEEPVTPNLILSGSIPPEANQASHEEVPEKEVSVLGSFIEVGPVIKVRYCTSDGKSTLEPPASSSLSNIISAVQKGINYSLLAHQLVPEEDYSALDCDAVSKKLLQALLGSSIQLIDNSLVERYVDYLAVHYQGGSDISFISQGMHVHLDVKDRSPKKVILREWARCKRIVIYPFVWPPRKYVGECFRSFPHIVFILTDKSEKKIYYFDSQGVTSNERSYPETFEDDPNFNMSNDLIELAEALSKQGAWELLENVTQYQTDPVNCGVYLLSRLERVYRTLDPQTIFDKDEEDITLIRRNLGKAFARSLNKKPVE